jgi:class 3 adenylate cyclase
MASTPPPAGSSHRTLAAIVFTDAVSFSARMQRDEVGTLTLLKADFADMRRLCAEHQGEVLKTTGDGLLMTFTSAVHAVAAALAMQNFFAARPKPSTPVEPLQHRVGIHLGDVLVQDNDVMGDGVNIASRLQAEAEPGGICISQTVYDVVKNKLELRAVSLGPRDLKNISQSVPVYRLLLEAESLSSGAPFPTARSAAPAASPRRGSRVLVMAGIAGALAVVFVAGMMVNRRAAKNPAVETKVATAPVVAAAATTARGEEETPDLVKRKETLQQLRSEYLDKYDFDGLVQAIRDGKVEPASNRNAPASGPQMLLHAAEQMAAMKDWLQVDLRRYNRQHPLVVHELSGDAASTVGVFFTPDKRLVTVENGTPKPHTWPEIKPALFAAIVVSAIHEAKPAAPREVVLGAQAFGRLANIPAVQEALGTPRVRRDKEPAAK